MLLAAAFSVFLRAPSFLYHSVLLRRVTLARRWRPLVARGCLRSSSAAAYFMPVLRASDV